jgi:hypothetical protein
LKKGEILVKNRIKWWVLGIVLMAIFAMTMMKTPEEITTMLTRVTSELTLFSAFVHVLFLVVVAVGLLFKKIRNISFFLFIAFLSLSATIISTIYVILPNILIFGTILVLIISAYLKKELNFGLEEIEPINKYFGILGLIFGFWYLHWVASPIWLNALLYSPLGAINCPTLVTICAFLILTVKPRSVTLEFVTALITLYFGFFGIFRLGAYVDVILIVCALFLIIRLSSSLTDKGISEKVIVENGKKPTTNR